MWSVLSQKVDGNMIFSDYWKVLDFNFSGMRNTVFFWDKTLMKRLCLLITEQFSFWTFRRWEIRRLKIFLAKKVDVKMIFLSFLWYSRTWEIRFFVFSKYYLKCISVQIEKQNKLLSALIKSTANFSSLIIKSVITHYWLLLPTFDIAYIFIFSLCLFVKFYSFEF